jgi:ribosomal protein L32
MTESHFDCENKLKTATQRMGFEKATEHMQKINGCGTYRLRHRYEIDGIRFHECLCGYRNPSISLYLDLEDKFNKGILPFNGSYLDQPSKIIEIMNRISQLKFDRSERNRKKWEQEQKNNR